LVPLAGTKRLFALVRDRPASCRNFNGVAVTLSFRVRQHPL
jgi:hypothetical protein